MPSRNERNRRCDSGSWQKIVPAKNSTKAYLSDKRKNAGSSWQDYVANIAKTKKLLASMIRLIGRNKQNVRI
jgi:hypothetical protein